MFKNIYNLMYGKTFKTYNIIYESLFNYDEDNFSILSENNEYICPDYIADETTITENIHCNDNYNIIQKQTKCIDFIILFLLINLFYIVLFLFLEKIFILFNIKNNKIKDKQNDKDIQLNDKDDIEEYFYDYSEIIKIQQYLNRDDNLDKVLLFYKESSNFLQQLLDIINDKYRHIFLNKEKFLNYYKNESDNTKLSNNTFLKFMDIKDNKSIYTSCRDKISVNLSKLYDNEQLILGSSVFNIHNNKKYFPLKKGQLCYITNLSKLNVIIWLIDIGFYDYLVKHI